MLSDRDRDGKTAVAQSRGFNIYTFLVVTVAVLAGMTFGLDSGATGPVTDMKGFREQIGWPTQPEGMASCGPDAYQDPSSIRSRQGIIVAIFHMGALIGAPLGGDIADRRGRRITIFFACLLFIAGSLWQTFAGLMQAGCGDCVYRDMLLGRFVGGIGLGFMLTTVPVYVSEMAPAHLRGLVGTSFQVSVNVGILFCSCFVLWASKYHNGWRYTLALQAIPAAIVAIFTVTFLPESPRYLAKMGKDQKAIKVLQRLSGTSDAEHIATAEFDEIKDELSKFEVAGSLSWREVFKGTALTSLLCGVAVAATQNITGINYFINFGPNIVKDLCLSPWLGSIAINVVNLLASIISSLVCDAFGRKTLLLWGTYFQCIAFAVNSILFTVVPDLTANRSVGICMFGFVCLFVAAFGLSWGPMGWLVPSEVLPLNIRSKGMGLAVTMNMIASIVFGDYGPIWLSSPDVLGIVGTWWLLTAVNFLWVLPVVVFLLPETKSLTLEEMPMAFAYQFGGQAGVPKRGMLDFFMKNARQALDISFFGHVDLRAGFEFKTKPEVA